MARCWLARLRGKTAARKVEVTMAYTIKVNAMDHSVDVDGDTPLLWVVCTENLNTGVMVMKSAQDGA
jgi:hypothetical protein